MPAAPSPLLLLRVGEGRGDAAAQSLSKITQYPRLGQARNGPTPRLPFIRNSKRTGGPTVAAATMQAKSTQNSLGSISILLVRLNFGKVKPFNRIPVGGFPVGAPPVLVPRPLAPVRHVRWTTADHGEQDATNFGWEVVEFRWTTADGKALQLETTFKWSHRHWQWHRHF